MRALAILVPALLAVSTAACTSYDPKLGAKPFLCGDNGSCPEGYSCTPEATTGAMECVISGPSGGVDASSDAVDGFKCADDSALEGPTLNNTVATASSTPVAGTRKNIVFAGLAICPDGDTDVYHVDITVEGQNLKAEATYDSPDNGGVALQLSILTSTGAPAASGGNTGENKVGVTAANLPVDVYYVKVFGPATGKNNYKLLLDVTGP